MRFSALTAFVVLGAGIANASPIRVVVTEFSSTGPIRYGHGAAGDLSDNHAPAAAVLVSSPSAAVVPPHMAMISGWPKDDMLINGTHHPHRTGCGGMRGKALDATNALRKWLGLEPIKLDVHIHPAHHMEGQKLDVQMHHAHHMDAQGGAVYKATLVHAMPMPIPTEMHGAKGAPILPYIGTPVRPAFDVADAQVAQAHGHHHFRAGHWRHRGPSFIRRLHLALMSLGPWEGRAVAFVLGCGIGVLLRMVWVIALVTVRAFRSRREDETEYEIVFDETEAEMLVAPPQYTVIEGAEVVPVTKDEKSEKN